jgi:hypothetical protein
VSSPPGDDDRPRVSQVRSFDGFDALGGCTERKESSPGAERDFPDPALIDAHVDEFIQLYNAALLANLLAPELAGLSITTFSRPSPWWLRACSRWPSSDEGRASAPRQSSPSSPWSR